MNFWLLAFGIGYPPELDRKVGPIGHKVLQARISAIVNFCERMAILFFDENSAA
jgi:hypothetical protein